MVVIETILATSAIGWVVTQLLNEVKGALKHLKPESANVRKLRDLLERLGPAVEALRDVSDEEHPSGRWLTRLRAQLEEARKIASATSHTSKAVDACNRVLRVRTVSKRAKDVCESIGDLLREAAAFQYVPGVDIEPILADNAEVLEMLRAAEEREERLFQEIANLPKKDEIVRLLEELQRVSSRSEQQISPEVRDAASTSTVPTLKFRKEGVWHVPKVDVTFGGEAVTNRVCDYLLNGEYKMNGAPHGRYKKWVGLWGMGGVGKTVTASKIYHDPRILNYFSGGTRWVTVSKEVAGPYTLFKQLTEQLTGREYVSQLPEDLEEAKSYVKSLLDRDRVLLVLDDVWEDADTGEDADGCRLLDYLDLVSEDTDSVILVTTRDKGVLEGVSGTCELFEIPTLSEVDSWRLFTWHAFPHHRHGREVEVPHELKEVAENLAKECAGLPLALEVIGSTMADKKISTEQKVLGLSLLHIWQRALDQLRNAKYGKHDYQRLLQRLQLSVDSLRGSCLLDCFLYFAAYPEDTDVNVENLVHIWVAEGLVQDDKDYSGELEGRFLIACLVAKSMVQLHMGYDGTFEPTFKTCKVHDVMRDVARHNLQWDFAKRKEIQASARECLFSSGQKHVDFPKEWTKSDSPSSAKRLSFMHNNLQQLPTPERFSARNLQVLLLSENGRLESLSLSFFQNLSNLRVLDLSKTGIERITGDFLLSLPSLVLLNLWKCTSLVYVSDEISTLSSLEFLELRDCQKLTALPRLKELTKLQFLAISVPSQDDEGAESRAEDDYTDTWAQDLEDDYTDTLAQDQEDDDADTSTQKEDDADTDADAAAQKDDDAAASARKGDDSRGTPAQEEEEDDTGTSAEEDDDRDISAEEDDESFPAGGDDDDLLAATMHSDGASEYDDAYDEFMADNIDAARKSCEGSTTIAEDGVPFVLPNNLKQVTIEGPRSREGKYIFDMSSLHSLQKLFWSSMQSFPAGLENLHQLTSFFAESCIETPVTALGKLDNLKFLSIRFDMELGIDSRGDEGAFPSLKTLDMAYEPDIKSSFVFSPGTMPRLENLKVVMSLRKHFPSSIRELRSLRNLKIDFGGRDLKRIAKDFRSLFTHQDKVSFPHLEHLGIWGTIKDVELRNMLPTYMLEKEREGILTISVNIDPY